MESLKEYMLAVTSTALICGVAVRLFHNKGFAAAAVKLLAGFCILLALITPLTKFSLPSFENFTSKMQWDSDKIIEDSKYQTKQALQEIIIQRVESYILEKADGCDGELDVEVALSDDDLPVPIAVKLSGNISPYWKKTITQMIEKDLGIAEEDQQWILKG